MTNNDIAAAFEKIALLLDLKGDENPFRIRAYERASMAISNVSTDLRKLYEEKGLEGIDALPGIGKDLALKIEEMIKTGKLKYLDELKKGMPPGLLEILEIEGMGPKRTKLVWQKFKVASIEDLQKLAESGKLEKLKGWGEKSVQNILRGIAQRSRISGRLPLPKAEPIVEEILQALRETGLADQLESAGSFRRRRETVGDIDILATSPDPPALMDAFTQLSFVDSITAKGDTKSTVFLKAGLDCDLRIVDRDAFGAALLYFTGSKDHNIHIRKMGIQKNLTLNEYGMFRGTAKEKGELVAAKTEEDVYRAVGLPWISPEIREDRGEIEAALNGALPKLIEIDDIVADLHSHSNFSDGSATMEEMAAAAKERGFQYIAITDHASPMGMVKGLKGNGESVKDYLERIEAARKKVKGIHILAGVEVDILEDGSLYLPDDILKRLDWVVASVHANFHQTREQATARLVRAVSHPLVHTLGHPTARMLGKREGIDIDIDQVFRAAKEHGTCIELNASFDRLDPSDANLRRGKEIGVKFSVGSDAHSPQGFDLRFGVSQLRRGWVEKNDVVNCLGWKEFEKWRASKK